METKRIEIGYDLEGQKMLGRSRIVRYYVRDRNNQISVGKKRELTEYFGGISGKVIANVPNSFWGTGDWETRAEQAIREKLEEVE